MAAESTPDAVNRSAGSVVFVRPEAGGVAHVGRKLVGELRSRDLPVVEVAVHDRGACGWVALRQLSRHWRAVRSATVVHVELGRTAVGAFWFALLASVIAHRVTVTLHDCSPVVTAPAAGLIRCAPGIRDVIAHRVLSPLFDDVLRSALRTRVRQTVALSVSAATALRVSGWPTVSTADHGADQPLPHRTPPSSGEYVLFAGYLSPSKGLDVLADAWQLLNQTNLPLWIAGQVSRQHANWLEALQRELSGVASDPPKWLGFVSDDDFEHLIANAAVVVLPYQDSNPVSGVLVRALVAGRAVVTTAVPAAAEVTHGRTALVVPRGDPVALARALDGLCLDPDLRDVLGAHASVEASIRHTWKRHANQLLAAIYESREASPDRWERHSRRNGITRRPRQGR